MEEILKKINQNAAERISQVISTMTKRNMGLEIAYFRTNNLSELKPNFAPEEEVVAFVYLPIHGDIKGSCGLILSQNDSFIMSDLLLERELGTAKNLDDMDICALKEMGNVFTGNILTIISNTIGVNLVEGQPNFTQGSFTVVLNEFINESARHIPEILIIESLFFFEPITIKGYLLFLFEKGKILESLGKKNE